tara:strand:+ start:2112 stop:2672 length:561 start_codon:yes stop_codon:yes gene_type:complete
MYRLLALALLATPAAHASDWVVDPDASTVTFETEAFGGPVNGEISDFTAQISLDPEAPGTGRIEARVGVSSVDAGSSQFNDSLQSSTGFAPDDHPDALFLSTDIAEADSCDAEAPARCFVASGTLTIKGNTQPADLPFSLHVIDGRAVADGQLVVHRTDFSIGGSAWGDAASDVVVSIHIEADAAD